MDTQESTTQLEDKRTIRRISSEGEFGFLWFLETSYGYMNPRGVLEHLSFAARFIGVYLEYRRAMKVEDQL